MQMLLRHMKYLCYFLSFVLIAESIPLSLLFAEEEVAVKNIWHAVAGDKIVIHYDLLGIADQEYNIKLVLKRQKDPRFVFEPKILSGDIGKGKFSGAGRQVVWDILREYPQGFDGDDFYFFVTVEAVSSSNLLYYLLAGAALGAGGYIFLKPKVTTNGENGWPAAPVRPGN